MNDRDELAKLLHERFASEFEDHWDDLDEQEQEGSEFRDMADVILAEFPPAHDARVRAEQRETDAQIALAEGMADVVSWHPGRDPLASQIAAAIRAVPANTNTEEGN